MENEAVPAPKRRLNALARVLRRGRIFARLREGWAYDEIAREEKLTAERVRQIVRETLDRRPLDEETDHAKLQLARLQAAMRIASEAVAGGDVTAIAPLVKVLDRLDRYQRTATINEVYDGDARKKLRDKFTRVAGNLGLAVIEDPAKAQAAQSPKPDEPKGPPAEKEKTPWGVGASP
jgi:hypothetical protein